MKEKIKKLEQWLSEGFAFIKSIAFMKKFVFEEGNVLMRAVIYSIEFFFFALIVLIFNEYSLRDIQNPMIKNFIFILFLTLAVFISTGSMILDFENAKKSFEKEREIYREKIKKLKNQIEMCNK